MLMVHDLLRDMAREIVRKESPKDPGKWSRLWYHKDVCDVLRKHKGTENIEGLSLKLDRDNIASFKTKAFEALESLGLLELNYVELIGSYVYISGELRWLCWEGIPLKFILDNFNLENLVALDMKYSNLRQVWKQPKALEKLKFLDLNYSHYLTHTPVFLFLPNLDKLVLADCKRLCEVHHSIEHLHELVLVNLKDCEILKNLPKDFYKLKSLETLILSGCSTIDQLDRDLGELVSLTILLAEHTAIKSLPVAIGRLVKLKE
ncbi:LRR domain containing protein [Parasponia andersonii]|uniref:LRR domain containing protein n=1 Tax=Parasponia andersonii TaxID=3476 RepID=A0A2P5AMW3_PARAD|nr:LRR domain containing protein [Parasponia andersonii]